MPVENFHIPGVILGAGITPYRDGRIVSQIDMAPTLLSLLGGMHPRRCSATTSLTGRRSHRGGR